MEFFYIKRELCNEYIIINSNSRSMDALYNFLLFDTYGMENIESNIKWLNGTLGRECKGICGEFASLRKDDQNIYIESDLDDDQDYAIFVMKKDAFVKMLEEWNAIYLKKPKEATFYFDGKKMTFDVVY